MLYTDSDVEFLKSAWASAKSVATQIDASRRVIEESRKILAETDQLLARSKETAGFDKAFPLRPDHHH